MNNHPAERNQLLWSVGSRLRRSALAVCRSRHRLRSLRAAVVLLDGLCCGRLQRCRTTHGMPSYLVILIAVAAAAGGIVYIGAKKGSWSIPGVPNVGLDRLSVSVRSYFRELDTEYRLSSASAASGPSAQLFQVIEQRAQNGRISKDDVRALEALLVGVLSRPRLLTWATSLEARYAEITGLKNDKPLSPPASDDEIRAYVAQLLANIHRVTILADTREERRRLLFVNTGVSLIVAGLAIAAMSELFTLPFHPDLNWLSVLPYLPLSSYVMIFGALGSAVSIMRRLGDTAIEDPLAGRPALLKVWSAPLLGAVFSLVLSMMFLGNLVQGPLFPKLKLDTPQHGWLLLGTFMGDLQPESWGDFAKLLLWSFGAGFFERLVPDAMQRVVSLDQATTS